MRPYLLPLFLLAIAIPVQAQLPDGGVLDTGVVKFELFDNGELGAFADLQGVPYGTGFVFEDFNALYEGTFLVGRSPTQVSGDIYERSLIGPDAHEWVNTSPLTAITPPGGFDYAYQTRFEDSAARGDGPIGLAVTATAFARAGDPFVFVRFEIENTSGTDLAGLHPGVIVDWDLSNLTIWAPDMACRDEAIQLLYAWDYFEDNPNRYGQMAVDYPADATVTGVRYYPYTFPAPFGDAELFGGLTEIQEPCPPTRIEVISTLGVGPFDLAAGESVTVTFAFVAGATEDEIIANAAAAQALPLNAAGPTEPANGVTLHAPAPNPARGETTLSFTLDRPMPIRLSVHDALGREVAVLTSGPRAAGEHRVTWAASRLPAGVYLVRLEAGGARLAQRVALLR